MKVKDGISSRAEGWETSWDDTGVIQLEEGGAPISVISITMKKGKKYNFKLPNQQSFIPQNMSVYTCYVYI